MKLILHIGTEKTGTSSVQQWGAKNRERLKKSGFFYSESLGVLDHRKASVYARLPSQPDDGFIRYGIQNVDQHEQFKREVEQALAKEVESARNIDCRYFFVSSEHFHSRIDNTVMVEEVKNLFSPYFDDIEILAYIRPQAELFQSRISVNVRNLDIFESELKNKWEKDITYFDYFSMWKRWSTFFSNVTFKPFNKHKNVVEDIAKIVDIDLKDFETPKRINEKLDYRMGLIAHQLNKATTSISMKKELIDLYFEQIECKEPITISKTLASKINKFYRDSNLKFCEANPKFPFNHIESDLKKFPINGTAEKMFNPNDSIDFLVEILIRNYCKINILQCENEFTKIERALARGNKDNAKKFKLQLLTLLKKFEEINFEKKYDLKNFKNKIDELQNKLHALNL